MPNHSDTISFSIEIGFMQSVGKKKVLISSTGYIFLEFNPRSIYDLSADQKKYLIRCLFFDGNLSREGKKNV